MLSLFSAIKKVLNLPSLPASVNAFHNYPLVRVFRVLGGISILLVLGKYELTQTLFYVIFPIAFMQFIYIIIISLIKFIYIIYLWKNKELEVKNSPLDRVATFSVKLITCVKGTCVLGLSGGTALDMGLGIDELLMSYGRDPIFRDTLGKGLNISLNSLGYENPNKDITKYNNDINNLKYRYNELKTLKKNDMDEL